MEEIKKKKSNKGLVVLIVLLVITIISILGFGYLKYTEFNNKYNNLNSKYEKVNQQLDNASKELESYKNKLAESNSNKTNSQYRVYSTMGYADIIGYNGELYLVQALSFDNMDTSNCISELTTSNGKIKFDNNVYTCKNDKNNSIRRLNIKESDIDSAFVTGFPASSDAQYSAFIIYKTGEVKVSHSGKAPITLKSLSNYKIKNIKKFYCSGDGWETCGSLRLDIVLQDGTQKTIKNFKYE